MNKSKSIIFSLLYAFSVSMANAATLEFLPGSQVVKVGDQVDVEIIASGLGNGFAPSVGAFDLNIEYDPAVFSFDSGLFGDQLDVWGFGFNPRAFDGSNPGSLNVYEVSFDSASDLDSLQPDTFVLFTVTFEAKSVGVSPLSVTVNQFVDSLAQPLAPELNEGSLSAVPVPAAIYLFGSGVMVLAGFRLRSAS